ncbi:hypothetical protein vseg_015762 [Gypsophila vaccaria]
MVFLNLIFTIFLLALSLFSLHLFPSTIQGRVLLNNNATHINPTTKSPKISEEEKAVIKNRQVMGSRPPKCQGRCGSCGGHCEAVQVPSVTNLEYARGEQSSDYKPITWKCQCGPFLYNP